MFIIPISQMEPIGSNLQVGQGAAAPGGGDWAPFSDVLRDAVEETQSAQKQADQDSYDLAMGRMDNLAGMMVNSLRLSTAVEVTTQLTTRAVSTYKEIMQMQV